MNEESVTETVVSTDYNCDMCGNKGMKIVPAKYDARTRLGVWAFMCEPCFKKWGIGLGLGKGQRLIKEKAND